MLKYFEPTYLTILSISIINWVMSASDIISFILATLLSILTLFYINEKRKGQKLANKKLIEEIKKLKKDVQTE